MSRGRRSMRSRRVRVAVVLAVVGVVAVAGGLVAFEPWRLVTRSTVNEEIPAAAGSPPDLDGPTPPRASPKKSPTSDAEWTPTARPRSTRHVPAGGRFVGQEHPTRGTVRILQLANGDRYVRLERFSTSDGPDLHVWITDQTAGGSWGKYDDGRYVRLGELKGTDGNQNYHIPAAANLSGMRSVVIWCDRFNVAFGSAPI
jgi:Electron transfer DM13